MTATGRHTAPNDPSPRAIAMDATTDIDGLMAALERDA